MGQAVRDGVRARLERPRMCKHLQASGKLSKGLKKNPSLRTRTTSCRGHAVTSADMDMRHLGSTTPVMDWEGEEVGDGEARSAGACSSRFCPAPQERRSWSPVSVSYLSHHPQMSSETHGLKDLRHGLPERRATWQSLGDRLPGRDRLLGNGHLAIFVRCQVFPKPKSYQYEYFP